MSHVYLWTWFASCGARLFLLLVSAPWCEEPTHWKRPWCWERLRTGAERGDRGLEGWMTSPIQWIWVWVNSGRWWRTGKPGMLESMGSQTVGHDWLAEQPWWLRLVWRRVPTQWWLELGLDPFVGRVTLKGMCTGSLWTACLLMVRAASWPFHPLALGAPLL